MFVYLSKKIAIPNSVRLRCVSWNTDEGYIACGGEGGLLKILRIDTGGVNKTRSINSNNLTLNQGLDGHSSTIHVVAWNERFHKLTSSDENGLIIVWMLHKGTWCEEMINNRNKSMVRGMAWNSEGQKICIVYDDGGIILGSVDGNRIWARDMKGQQLTGVEWSPDSRLLLFALTTGEIHIYDNSGGYVCKMNVQCLEGTILGATVAGLKWYNGKNGYVEPNCPCLCICYSNGRMQIMKNHDDEAPIMLDTGMDVADCQWNDNGSVLVVAGALKNQTMSEVEGNAVQFYSPFGEHLRTLKVPGKELTSCSWEGGGLRLAMAVDTHIFFANVRPAYKWCSFGDVIVYSYSKPERPEICVTFWDSKNNEHYIKHIKYLTGMTGNGEHCCLAVKTDDGSGQFGLIICSAIGTPVDSKYIDIEPIFLVMTSTFVVAASKENFCFWNFKTPDSHSSIYIKNVNKPSKQDRIYHIDDTPKKGLPPDGKDNKLYQRTSDPICCITANEKALLVSRESGNLNCYSFPEVVLMDKRKLTCKPNRLTLNCNSSKLALIDITGTLLLMEFNSSEATTQSLGPLLKFERKDVWDLCWAEDNPDLFAIMEKNKMHIFRNFDAEDPITSSGYFCSFKNLEVKTVLLDEVMQEPDAPSSDFIRVLEAKSLREIRDLMEKGSTIKEVTTFIESSPHRRLWNLLATAALEKLDLETAESAFVRCKDYPGIQFVKKLSNIQSEKIRRAEIKAFLKDFDEAENIFLANDRPDLAINLRRTLGDWSRVYHLLKSSGTGTDKQREEALNNIGEQYAEKQQWEEAAKNFEQSHNHMKLAQCYYALEDFDSLESLVKSLPETSELLPVIAEQFAVVGMCPQSVEAFLKCHKIKAAIDVCVELNQWQSAIELAKEHHVPETSVLLSKYASHLLSTGQRIQAIELFKKADKRLEAAKILFEMADEELQERSSPLRVKKLFVLGALLVTEHNILRKQSVVEVGGSRSEVLMGLYEEPNDIFSTTGDFGGKYFGEGGVTDGHHSTFLPRNSKASDMVATPWRGAEAMHFLLLAQRQLYEGYVDAAMKTALHLREFEGLLPAEDIYALLSLASCANRAFATCSKAFIKLEALPDISVEKRESFEDLAIDLFSKYSPKDSRSNREECTKCETMIPDWVGSCPSCNTRFPVCIVTGRPIMDPSSMWTCKRCNHSALDQDMTMKSHCPMCHVVVIVT